MGTLQTKEKRISHLIDALSSGWEIEEPVILGAVWGNTTNGNDGVYHFVLRNKAEDKTTMLSLPPSPELLVFLAENKVDINSL